jgi:hypothetical protein
VPDEVLAGAAGAAQADCGRAIRGQGCQPGAVGAQGVGQDERVEAVVFVTGRPVAAAQVLDLVRADHRHGDPRIEQDVDDRAVGALDRGLASAGAARTLTSSRRPAALCSTVHRRISRPLASTTDTA